MSTTASPALALDSTIPALLPGAYRRRVAASDILLFSRLYLPHYVGLPPSRMHVQLAQALRVATLEARGSRLAVAAPRGHAKSTLISLAFILWCVCYGREKFIYLISDTISQAIDLLSHVKYELERNDLLLSDFPEACEPAGSKPGPPRWCATEIITRNDVKIRALGAGVKIRGRRHREFRPTLIILDDIENDELVLSADRREKLRNWLHQVVLKAGDKQTNVVLAGTVLHYDSLLANALQSPGWNGRKYQAVERWSDRPDLWDQWEAIYTERSGLLDDCEPSEGVKPGDSVPRATPSSAAQQFFHDNAQAMLTGTQVLWPEKEDYHALMLQRAAEGRLSFDSEKQNEPVNPQDRVFREGDFLYWDSPQGSTAESEASGGNVDAAPDADALIARLRARGGSFCIVAACDPALGKVGRPGSGGDDTAIITLLVERQGQSQTYYVLDADIARRRPDSTIETLCSYHDMRGSIVGVPFEALAIEANQFQEYFADEVKRRMGAVKSRADVKIQKITQTRGKISRIQALQPLIHAGRLRFSRRHQTLLDQLRLFPHAAKDDAADALALAITCAKGYPAPEIQVRVICPNRGWRRNWWE